MKKLSEQLNEIERLITKCDAFNERVSAVSVGWQLSHSMKTICRIVEALESSTPSEYKKEFSMLGMIFINLKWLPRGKAKAPKVVRPSEEITEQGLRVQLKKTKALVKKLPTLKKESFFPHPYFKDMRLKSAIRFLEIHTEHHLKIVRDICRE
jgi:hypothetical protein